MRHNLQKCLALVLGHEGGYVNHPRDPGGATNRGVTQRVYDAWRSRSKLEMQSVRQITKAEVKSIYKRQYWMPTGGDALADGIDYANFDAGVNSGPRQANKWLQRVLGVKADGIVGQKTLTAAASVLNKTALIQAMVKKRSGFLRSLRHWTTFKRGWMRRLASVEAEAVKMSAASDALARDMARHESKRAITLAKKQTAGAGASGASGVGSASQIDPLLASTATPWIIAAIAAACVVSGIILLRRAAINRERSTAYQTTAHS